MNTAISDWNRVCRYIQRFNILEQVLQSEPMNYGHDSLLSNFPQDYIDFIHQYGFPTLYLDEDIYIQFYPQSRILQHPSYTSSFIPFATCDFEERVILGFEKDHTDFQVISYEDNIILGKEGNFKCWMKKQVTYFLTQMSHFNFSEANPSYRNRMERGK